MHIRSLSVQEQWLRIENTIPFVREVVQPTVGKLDGNLGLCMLVDQRKPQCIVLSGWESEQAMHASDPAIAPVRAEAETRLGGGATVEQWEVAALRRTREIYPGCWVSVTRLTVPSGSVDRMVEAYRGAVVADAAGTPGARAALLAVHRAEGRAAAAVAYDNYAALHAASRRQGGLHDLSAAGAVVGDVGEYEVEIAGTRLPESV